MNSTRPHRTFGQWAVCYLCNFSLIAIVGVLSYVLFFTDTSVQTTYHYEQEAESLKHQIAQERDSLEYYEQLNQKLASDRHTIEKEARENYHLRRPHEDVYIIK